MQITCPKCQGEMRQYERAGVTIDQCTECRGIFLDRGELERLIDAESSFYAGQPAQRPAPPAAAPAPAAPAPGYPQAGYPPARYRDYDSDEYPAYDRYGRPRRNKRHSFLSELFD